MKSFRLTLFAIISVLFATMAVGQASAQEIAPIAGGGYEIIGPDFAVPVPAGCIPDGFVLGTGSNAGLIQCVIQQMNKADENTIKQLQALQKKQQREEFWDNLKEQAKQAIAAGFKASLRQFSQQLAYDTATWIASGGKGQQPLFVTEGWGAYLQNAGDEALGVFIDTIDQKMGTSLCRPNFSVRIAMIRGLDTRAPRKPSCRLSTMMTNWRQAVQDPQFGFEYGKFFEPGENDLSSFFILQTGISDELDRQLNESVLSAIVGEGYKDVSNFAGWIQTPGTMIRDIHKKSLESADKAEGVWTGTIWDFIETFLNTLMSQLLQNLQAGFVSSNGSDGDGNRLNFPNVSALFNPNASPQVEGRRGAQERFSNLISPKITVGGSYDILNKLTQCSDQSKTNPGPTDCVIDTDLAGLIRNRTLVKNMGTALDRPFARPINVVANPQTEFTLRNIMILRKYRIVPIGWEVAAQKIAAAQAGSSQTTGYTLRSIMNEFNQQGSQFYGLVDPNWLLKAPELFCRRQGFGGRNIFAQDQTDTIQRAEYCADEQQCIREDENGRCIAYGYCTQERRSWDFNVPSCQPVFNTCQTFQSAGGATVSYLANTLDYRNCNADNAGCQWYSGALDPVTRTWAHSATSDDIHVVTTSAGGTSLSIAGGAQSRITQWHNTSLDGTIVMEQACSATSCTADNNCTYVSAQDGGAGYCQFTAGTSCFVSAGATRCAITSCAADEDIMAEHNGDFGSCSGWDAAEWTEGYQGASNRFSCITSGRSSGALEGLTISNTEPVVSTLDAIPVTPGAVYSFSFWSRVPSLTEGGYDIVLTANGETLRTIPVVAPHTAWREYGRTDGYVTIPSGVTTVRLTVTARPLTNGQALFDDFSLRQVMNECANRTVWLLNNPVPFDHEDDQATAPLWRFDRDVQTCDGRDGGCTRFIRTLAGVGSNLLRNPDFEIPAPANRDLPYGWRVVTETGTWPAGLRLVKDQVHSGATAAQIDIYNDPTYRTEIEVAPEGAYQLNGSTRYSASAYVYATVGTDVALKLQGQTTRQRVLAGEWSRVTVMVTQADPDTTPELRLAAVGTTSAGRLYIDSVKLEEVMYDAETSSTYTGYAPSSRPANQIATLKKAPDYLGCYDAGAGAGTQWPQNDAGLATVLQQRQAACTNYAQVCTPGEVGCELFTPIGRQEPAVPGRATMADFCPVETRGDESVGVCNGYQVYHQEQTQFTQGKFVQFIANNDAKYCSPAAAGCDEFTNLNAPEQGGESRAYFSRIRACQRPASDGQTYYTWEGSDTAGYQLRAYDLKRSQTGGGPCTNLSYPETANGANTCADPVTVPTTAAERAAVGYCTAEDMVSNTDCREFYDTDGRIHHRLLSRTIANTDQCTPFRRTQTQTSVAEAAADCQASQGYWNGNNECVYMVVPNEARRCSQAVVGCREYTGNRGNNIRAITTDTFEGSVGAWQYGTLANESNYPGGSSLKNTAPNRQLQRPVTLEQNRAYTLSFWAKGDGSFTVDGIKFTGAQQRQDAFALATGQGGARSGVTDGEIQVPRVEITPEWQRYDLGPVFVTWDQRDDEALEITLPNNEVIYIDNIILTEVQQKVYAIENSWFTPVACDNKLDDPDGAKAAAARIGDPADPADDQPALCPGYSPTGPSRCSPGEMIGCAAYRDRAGQVANLRSFDKLCRPGAVGCEALIDTQNSESPLAETFLEGDAESEISTQPDQMVYLVNDRAHACDTGAVGCTELGRPLINQYDEIYGYQSVYLRNLPDRYSSDLCRLSELWCDAFAGSRTTSYFKDPRNKICEHRTVSLTAATGSVSTQTGWFRRGTTDPCPVTETQTIGLGGANGVKQPLGWMDNVTGQAEDAYQGLAGACPATASTCTEFIDPLNVAYPEIIINGGFEQPVLNAAGQPQDSLAANWVASAVPFSGEDTPASRTNNGGGDYYVTVAQQEVRLNPNTLYTLTAKVEGTAALIVDCNGGMWSPDGSMPGGRLVASSLSGSTRISGRFYPLSSSGMSCSVVVAGQQGLSTNRIYDVSLVRSGVYYVLGQSVDRSSCGGVVDNNNGCVLLDDRSEINYADQTGAGRSNSYLVFNADTTYEQQITDPEQRPIAPVRVDAADPALERNANAVIKVTPDRTCDSWLTCTTYERTSETGNSQAKAIYGNFDRCLDLALCSSLNASGECDSIVPRSVVLQPVDGSDRSQQMKSGYAIPGQYNFADMRQSGGATTVVNGNFESVFSASGQPVGWQVNDQQESGITVQQDSSNPIELVSQSSVGWSPARYTVVRDQKNTIEGAGYLRLNSFYEAISDPIDFQPGATYTISYWVNTTELKPPSGSSATDVQARLVLNIGNGARRVERLVESGLGWTHVTEEFSVPAGVTQGTILLRNAWVQGGSPLCVRPTDLVANKACQVSGFSRYDNIVIKPVLEVSEQRVGGQLVPVSVDRSCRVYPAQDALSCQYFTDNNFFYGQFGYCVMTDPANSQQCLQWWPVDQIQGETVDEISGYMGRRPLYYCVEKQSKNIDVGVGGAILRISAQKAPGLASAADGGASEKYQQFNIADDYRSLIRWPFVQKFVFQGFMGMVGSSKNGIIRVQADMYNDRVSLKRSPIFGSGAAALDFITSAFTITYVEGEPRTVEILSGDDRPNSPDTIVCDQEGILEKLVCELGNVLRGITNTVTTVIHDVITNIEEFINRMLRVFTFTPQDRWGGWGLRFIIINDFPILVFTPWSAAKEASLEPILMILSQLDLVDVDGGSFGLKIITDQDSGANNLTDPVPTMPGDILGISWFMNSASDPHVYGAGVTGYVESNFDVEYCSKVVQVVTSAGTNKAYAARTTSGSGYISPDRDCVYNSLRGTAYNTPGPGLWAFIPDAEKKYVTTDDYCAVKDAGIYTRIGYEYATDYPPYGAIVAPSSGQYPPDWDSKSANGVQPLFYEIADTGMSAPGQPRLGQLQSETSLQHLFGRTYGTWQWNDDRGYQFVNNGIDWLIGMRRCAAGENHPIGSVQGKFGGVTPCYIAPQVTNMRINDGPSAAIVNNGSVKLTFNTIVDKEQLPIRSFTIAWGDGTTTVVSGASLRDRANTENPMMMYHFYDFRQLQQAGVCATQNSCQVTVTVSIRDNWDKQSESGGNTATLTVTKE